MTSQPLSPASYWEHRARTYAGRGRGLAAVCSYGMPEFYNRYIDWIQQRALAPWLHRAGDGRSALDVGCGVGRWSLQLAQRGYDVTGIDISAYMIRQACKQANRRSTNA
jgi:2-polyprenyl-3-methyl-5-hydroxy-6-metoxy-1,4-benzoquinol methylase